MMVRILLSLILAILSASVYSQGESVGGVDSARKLVTELQQLPAQEIFCSVENWETGENGAPEILMPKFELYFSKEMLKVFVWANCRQPKRPRMLEAERSFYFDFRYGTQAMGGSEYVKNIRVETPRATKGGKLTVQVLWDDGGIKNTWTRYTLIKENGSWKIDDIALKGYETDAEEILPSSKSLKTELQAAYKCAEERYKRDQAAKGVSGK